MPQQQNVAELLLQHNADIEARDKDNRTPLHSATYGKSVEVAKLLLQHGANNEAKDKDNRTPLQVARSALRNSEAAMSLVVELTANNS